MDDLWRGWLLDQPRSGKQELLVRRLGASTSSHGFTRLRRRNLSSDELCHRWSRQPRLSARQQRHNRIQFGRHLRFRSEPSPPVLRRPRSAKRVHDQRLLILPRIAMDVLTRPRDANARCAAAIATDVGRQSGACRIASVGDSSAVEPASTNLFDSRRNALCRRRTRRVTW
jgi:hypothetical protein